MTTEADEIRRLKHHIAGLQQTVLDQGDRIVLKDEAIAGLREDIVVITAEMGKLSVKLQQS